MRELIAGWEQTRGSLQRTLDHAGLLAGRDVPRTLAEMRQSLAAATRLSGRVQQETAATGPAIRRTLGQVDRAAVAARATATAAGETATSARRAADEASLVLGSSRPLLLKILHDLQAVSGRTERLLRSLLGSEALAPAADDGGGGSPVNGAPR
jgi:ABC-type transporter Mla subunit MlaD